MVIKSSPLAILSLDRFNNKVSHQIFSNSKCAQERRAAVWVDIEMLQLGQLFVTTTIEREKERKRELGDNKFECHSAKTTAANIIEHACALVAPSLHSP